jgi:anti-sigma regulatory factor (Ser/Thr protein kinase)
MTKIHVTSENDIARCVIEVSRVAKEIQLGETNCNKAATAVSELARNILKYAGNGDVLIETIKERSRIGISITVTDRGPGIANIEQAMNDHFSTSGTLGLGLPGVKRLMDEFEIDSQLGRGTRVSVKMWTRFKATTTDCQAKSTTMDRQAKSMLMRAVSRQANREGRPRYISGSQALEPLKAGGRLESAFVIRPCRGEIVSGDAVVLERRSGVMFVAIIDGLGHGASANAAAERAASFLRQSWSSDVVKTMHGLHESLKDTIGAVAGICVVDAESRSVRYAGVGNTVIRTFGTSPARLHSSAGTLGERIRGVHEQRLQLKSRDTLLLYTDGVSDRFELDEYPALLVERPETIAKSVVEKFGKEHDDASCVAVRFSQ